MKRIAILFEGSIYERKGLVNAVLERAKRMCRQEEYEVQVFCIMSYENMLVRCLRHSSKIPKRKSEIVDGIKVQILWKYFSLLDYVLANKLNRSMPVQTLWCKKVVNRFEHFDLLLAHSTLAAQIAMNVQRKYGTPFCVTWHGSDIHTLPFQNKKTCEQTREIMKEAARNIYVSKALFETAKQISPATDSWMVAYNGVSENFRNYSHEELLPIRHKYGLKEGDKVIGFVGGLVPVKNADKLPDIFSEIQKRGVTAKFWIIGDGKLFPIIQNKIQTQFPELDCTLWGNQPTESMPDMMNCIDILLLPSKNEGLPLVTVEALRSGTHVVAANVGGIIEVVGPKNVINHGDDFVAQISQRCVEICTTDEKVPQLPDCFDWDKTVAQELREYEKVLK